MRITILTAGSRGDVQPYLALGLGLKAAGHDVCLATECRFKRWVLDEGLDYGFLPGDTKARFTDPNWHRILQKTRNRPLMSVVQIYRFFRLPIMREFLDAAWIACKGSDAIIATPTVMGANHIASRLGVPYYIAWTCPFTSTSEFPHSWSQFSIHHRFGRWFNRFSYWTSKTLEELMLKDVINQWRRETLGFPKLKRHEIQPAPVAVLYLFSSALVSPPEDWDNNIHVTGYWFLERPTTTPPKALTKFLKEGPPPVYIGFGSIGDRNATKNMQTAIDAVIQSGQRVLVEKGWSELKQLNISPDVFVLEPGEVSHAWLFPQMAALIHHGGSGTVGEGCRAGKPALVIYQKFTDYYFWGQRLAEVGVGPRPIFIEKLTIEELKNSVYEMLNNIKIKSSAAQVGQQIRAEDGISRAIDLFHHYYDKHSEKTVRLRSKVQR